MLFIAATKKNTSNKETMFYLEVSSENDIIFMITFKIFLKNIGCLYPLEQSLSSKLYFEVIFHKVFD